jgi:hypothetical protein
MFLRTAGESDTGVAVCVNAAVRDDPVVMDDPSPSGPGMHVNAHREGVFRAPSSERFGAARRKSGAEPDARLSPLKMSKTVSDIKVTSMRMSGRVGARLAYGGRSGVTIDVD